MQYAIANMDMNEVNLPSSIEVILIFLLGLPGRMKKISPETFPLPEIEWIRVPRGGFVYLYSFVFIPFLTPQDIEVKVDVFEVEGKEEKIVEIGLITGSGVTEFHWENWINSAMEFIKKSDDYHTKLKAEDGKESWRKRIARQVNLTGPLVTA